MALLSPKPRDADVTIGANSELNESSSDASATLAAITSVKTDEEDACSEKDFTRSEDCSLSLGGPDAVENLPESAQAPILERWPAPRTPSPEVIQEGLPDVEQQDLQEQISAFKSQGSIESMLADERRDSEKPLRAVTLDSESSTSEESDDGPAAHEMQGRLLNKHGVEVRIHVHAPKPVTRLMHDVSPN